MKAILERATVLLRILALIALPCAVLAGVDGDAELAAAFGAFVLTGTIAGIIGHYRLRGSSKERSATSGLMKEVAVAWLLVAMVGSIPFRVAAAFAAESAPSVQAAYGSWSGAFFESMSGFTSTGLSMTSTPSELPGSLQLWRSLCQWVGGLGVVFFGILATSPSERAHQLSRFEGRRQQIDLEPRERHRRVFLIYLVFTLLTGTAFHALGMPLWEAINHAMTSVSTGGFAVTDQSFAGYSSSIKLAAMLVLIVGALSFFVHDQILRMRSVWQLSSLRAFLVLCVVGALAALLLTSEPSWIDATFLAVSAATTAGFHAGFQPGAYVPMVTPLILLMIIGGCSGSTAGGIKVHRAVWLGRAIHRRVQTRTIDTDEDPPYSFDGDAVDPDDARRNIQSAAVFTLLWLLVIVVATALLSLPQANDDFAAVLFDASSALSGVGLSSGFTGADLTTSSKLLLIVMMWAGRLEIIAVVILLATPWRLIRDRFGLARNS